MKMLKKTKSYFLYIIVTAFLLLILFCILKKDAKIFYDLPSKIWAHRGLSLNCKENTLKSTKLAFENGFPGVEMDIWYDKYNNSFVVKHDKNINSSLFLTHVFNNNKKQNERFWLDLKNLTSKNQEQIIQLLKALEKKHNIKNRVIIESPNASSLSMIKLNGFYTSLYLKPIKNVPLLYNLKNNIINLFNICVHNFNAVSLPADSYVGLYKFLYKRNNVHLWVFTKDLNTLEKLRKRQEVKIILFDGKL